MTLDYTEELARAHPTVRSLADSCASPIIQVYPDGYSVWMFCINMTGSWMFVVKIWERTGLWFYLEWNLGLALPQLFFVFKLHSWFQGQPDIIVLTSWYLLDLLRIWVGWCSDTRGWWALPWTRTIVSIGFDRNRRRQFWWGHFLWRVERSSSWWKNDTLNSWFCELLILEWQRQRWSIWYLLDHRV